MPYNKVSNRCCLLGLTCALGFSSLAHAEPDLSLSGFASISYAKAIDEDAVAFQAGSDPAELSIASGYDFQINESGEYTEFNRFGLRLNADMQQNLSFGAQVIANGEDDYEPAVDWLYVQYDFTPNISVKAGRTNVPLFMYSDYLDVTYAHPWIDVPAAVYGTGTVKTNQGIMLDWRADMGNGWTSLVTAFTGQVEEYVPLLNGDIVIDDGLGLVWDVEYEWLRLRAVYYQGKSSVDSVNSYLSESIDATIVAQAAGLNVTIDPIPLSVADTADFDTLAWENDDTSYMGLGLGLDFETVFFTAEATSVDVDETAAVGQLDSWYALIGTRLPGDWSLTLTYSGNDDEASEVDYTAVNAELIQAYGSVIGTPGATQLVNGVSDGVEKILYSARYEDTKSYTLGARWDFHPSASFKVEYMQQTTTLVDYNLKEFERKPSAYRVGVDLVF